MEIKERSRNYAMMTYHPVDVVKKVLDTWCTMGRIRHYAYIIHDKDVDENGKLKEKHMHLLLNLNNAMTLTAVRALFPDGANTLGQVMYDKSNCFEYLTHKNDQKKYQYPDSDIVADNTKYWHDLKKCDVENVAMNIIDDILAKVSFRALVDRYGRDVIINKDKYFAFAALIECEERDTSNYSPAKPKPYLIDEDGVIVKPTPKQMEIEP